MSEEKRDHGNIYMWVMEHGIENFKYMCLLEREGYKISYETGGM